MLVIDELGVQRLVPAQLDFQSMQLELLVLSFKNLVTRPTRYAIGDQQPFALTACASSAHPVGRPTMRFAAVRSNRLRRHMRRSNHKAHDGCAKIVSFAV